jgi:hypothetical protein
MVRAKMRCVEKVQRTQAYGVAKPVETEGVILQAVTGPGNEEWSQWTPAGKVEMSITNPNAINQFEVGKDYFVDFSPAD